MPSSESIKLKVQHMLICLEIDYTTISTLQKLIFLFYQGHKLIDK